MAIEVLTVPAHPAPPSGLAAWGTRYFTLGRDPTAEAVIGAQLHAIAAAVRASLGAGLIAVVLVGSYARGDGAVVLRDGVPGAFNDYDLLVVVPHVTQAVRGALARLGATWTAHVGVDVDFWPIATARIARAPPTLFWLDAAQGGARVLDGPDAILRPLRTLRPREVPLEECGRLLANRAVGLALSNFDGPDGPAAVTLRHGHKSVLACGDALLLAVNDYAPGIGARLDALRVLEGVPAVEPALVVAYASAVRFRERPDLWRAPGGATVWSWYTDTRDAVGLWHLGFETRRTGAPSTPAAFARFRGRLYPALRDVAPGGALVAALRARAEGAATFFPYVGHPRERLARVATALAYGWSDPAARAAAADLLGADIDTSNARARLVALSHRGG